MSTKRSGVCSLLLLLVVSADLFGGLVAPGSLQDLQQNANLIIVGNATGAVQSGTVVDLSILVSRVIKGDTALAGRSIAAHWMSGRVDTMVSRGSADSRGDGLWFLQQASNGWRVLPVVQGNVEFTGLYFPVSSGPILNAYAYSQTASVVDKLASEIGAAIENQNGYNFQLYALQTGMLDELKSPIWGLLYQRMANSTSAERKILGLSGLIRAGNASALAAAAPITSSLGDHPAQGILLLSIRDFFRATDADSVVAIGSSATDSSQSAAFREAAAHALAAIHTAASLPFLATLLEDPNQNLRIEAIGGMAAFANGLAVQTSGGVPSLSHLQLPSNAPYKTVETVAHLAFGRQAIAPNEASYLSFWKSWWEQNRASLGY